MQRAGDDHDGAQRVAGRGGVGGGGDTRLYPTNPEL